MSAPLVTFVSQVAVTAPRAAAVVDGDTAWVLTQLRAKQYVFSRQTGVATLVNDGDLMGVVSQPRDLDLRPDDTLVIGGDGGLMTFDPFNNSRALVPGFSGVVSVACRDDGRTAVATASQVRVFTSAWALDYTLPLAGTIKLDWDADGYLHCVSSSIVRVYNLLDLYDEYGDDDGLTMRAGANDALGNSFLLDSGFYLRSYDDRDPGRRFWLGQTYDDVALAEDGLVLVDTQAGLVKYCYLDYQSAGPQGPTGPAGPQGMTGPQGPEGAGLLGQMMLGGM